MIGKRTIAETGSTAIGGDNSGMLVNISADSGAVVSVQMDSATVTKRLPMQLAAVISQFARASAQLLSQGVRQELLPDVVTKLRFNNLPATHRIIHEWLRHAHILHKSYQGVEQSNQAARYLVKRKAGVAYDEALSRACHEKGISVGEQQDFARENAVALVGAVVDRLLIEYSASSDASVEAEMAHLAISLVVADAIIECEVLERPSHASAA